MSAPLWDVVKTPKAGPVRGQPQFVLAPKRTCQPVGAPREPGRPARGHPQRVSAVSGFSRTSRRPLPSLLTHAVDVEIGQLKAESSEAGPVRGQPQFVLAPKHTCNGSRRSARTGAPRP